MNGSSHVNAAYTALKYTYGLVAIVAGADKFLNYITHWAQYLSPVIARLSPISTEHLMYGVGVIEMVVGFLILSGQTKLGAYLASAWLLLIAVNLVSMGTFYDIAVRDVVMAVGAYALAQLAS